MFRAFLLVLWIVFAAFGVVAQEVELLASEVVQVEATDGLALVGDYYAVPADGDGRAVLLIHMLSSRRSAWEPLIPALNEAGYAVLNIDMRGHGDTGGRRDWVAAETDVQTWLDWLREQDGVRAEAVSIVGGSIGSNLALMGCANDAACVTAVALSPGLNYQGVEPKDSVVTGLSERSALLVASHRDSGSAVAVEEMAADATGEIGLRLYTGSAHGTALFRERAEAVNALIVAWLDEHTPPVEG
jgi:alpha-beta hydrolase superfamily lysophospholipase